MNTLSLNTEAIKEVLKSGKDISDLTRLLNLIISSQNESGAAFRKLTPAKVGYYYANLAKHYRTFAILKKSGGERLIQAPDKYLIKIQRRISLLLYHLFKPTESSHGFLLGRSIKSNAEPHVSKKNLLNMDLEDYFPSITFFRIRATLKLKPFEMSPQMAHLIANFCCLNGRLPQGAPTSPIISNIVSQRLDRKINAMCRRFDVTYTRYADDLSFSWNENLPSAEFQKKINYIIEQEGFRVKHEKTRMRFKNSRQEVTGLVVNEKVNVNREWRRILRAEKHRAAHSMGTDEMLLVRIKGKANFERMIKER